MINHRVQESILCEDGLSTDTLPTTHTYIL